MNMKMKTLVFALCAMAASLCVKADGEYLCWMVSVADDYAFSYATVSSKSGALLYNYSGDPTSTEGEQYIGHNGTGDLGTKTEKLWAYDVSAYKDSSFIFELFDAEDERIGYQVVSYSSLSGTHIGSGMDEITPYILTSVIPEPTSGMLLLFGLAGLALRRRTRV